VKFGTSKMSRMARGSRASRKPSLMLRVFVAGRLAAAAAFHNRSAARLRLFGSCTVVLHDAPPWRWARRDCRPTTRVAPQHFVDPDWHLLGLAKAGSSRVRAWTARLNEERGHADRLPNSHPQFARSAAAYEAGRAATFVRDPFERLASAALELMRMRGGTLFRTAAAADHFGKTIGHGYRPIPGKYNAEPTSRTDWGLWAKRVDAFARSLVRDDLNGSLDPRRGWAPVDVHVAHQAVSLARACPRVAYIGDMRTNARELDALFGRRAAAERSGAPLYARSSLRPPHFFPDDLAREICRFYLVDFCCLDPAYRRRCEALGVPCPADMVFRPP